MFSYIEFHVHATESAAYTSYSYIHLQLSLQVVSFNAGFLQKSIGCFMIWTGTSYNFVLSNMLLNYAVAIKNRIGHLIVHGMS